MSYVSDHTDQHVLQIIKEFQNERECGRVSANDIAQRVGCSTKTVLRAVQRLEAKGKLKFPREKGIPLRYEIVED